MSDDFDEELEKIFVVGKDGRIITVYRAKCSFAGIPRTDQEWEQLFLIASVVDYENFKRKNLKKGD